MKLFDQAQKRFLDEVKRKIPGNISLAEVIADDLNISNDSAYRRIRGDTHLTLAECTVLCNKYNVSLDSLFENSASHIMFNYRAINQDTFTFESYFRSILENLETIKQFEEKEMIFAENDILPFHLFKFEGLAAFKLFFWMSNIHHFPQFENTSFNINNFSKELLGYAKQVWESYVSIPSIEIWSDENINVTLRQIEFIYDCGKFNSKDVAMQLYEELKEVILHIQKQADRGYKYLYGKENAIGDDKNFQLYYNEVTIMDTTVLIKMGDTRMVLLGHNVVDILTTADPLFCEHTHRILDKIIKNATLISVVGEKVRKRFFLKLIAKIDQYIDRLKSK